jgi:primosomal protein N' (replication factor Y)
VPRLVDVVLPLPLAQRFTYALPEGAAEPPRGGRVLVGFRGRRLVGFAVGEPERSPVGVGVRSLERVLDAEPVLSDTEWALAEWMARYYVAPLGLVLKLFFPPGALQVGGLAARGAATGEPVPGGSGSGGPAPPLERFHVLPAGPLDHAALERARAELARAPAQRRVLEAALALAAPVEQSALCEELGVSPAAVRALADRGLVRVEPRPVTRDPLAAEGALPTAPEEGPVTEAQAQALEAILSALGTAGERRATAGRAEVTEAAPTEVRPFLLQGITGSGKTRVYVEAAAAAVDGGGRAVVLVPEIGLAAPAVARFRARFGDQVALLHSALSDGERADAWRRIHTGEIRVVVGARSALFAPMGSADLIVVDEEHEAAYKQDETPRYHARDVAVMRAAIEGGVVVLGSATPSIETRANAETGKYRRLVLPERIAGRPLPTVEIVDLKDREIVAPGLSDRMVEAIAGALDAGDQALLFLNRRGFASFLQCLDCGWVPECPNCRISLTYHRGRPRLLCHYCAHTERVPDACPSCRSVELDARGLGTQQIESGIAALFPDARLARMDLDTTGAKGSHARIYRAMQRRELDVLVGTQMIAKGFDLPGVAVVGVVSADTGLHFPDFRATERTFQLLVQVAGRAGRGNRPGRVILQTWLPSHHAIGAAAAHDYEGFWRREADTRRGLGYPPAARLANVVVSGADADAVGDAARRVAERVRAEALPPAPGAAGDDAGEPAVEVVGPAPCPLERLRGRWRWHLLLKSRSAVLLELVLRDLARNEAALVGSTHRLELDRDPMSLL